MCRLGGIALVAVLAGCSAREEGRPLDEDGGPRNDARVIVDASGTDGHVPGDAAPGGDAGAGTDAGGDDGGSSTDAGSDAGAPSDAGVASDAGVDASVPLDAGYDASLPDAGPGGCTDGTCPSGFYCETPMTMCSGAGTCVAIPTGVFCPAVFDPVCGCDGNTYSNDCYRRLAGVAKDHDGACGSTI